MPADVEPARAEAAFGDQGWTLDTEVPDADAHEQQQAVVDEDEAADPERAVGRPGTPRPDRAIDSANDADLAEQDIEVPYDDDEEDRG